MMVLCGRAATNPWIGVTPSDQGEPGGGRDALDDKAAGAGWRAAGVLISTELELLVRLQAWNVRSAIVIERFIRLASGDERGLLQSVLAKTY